MKKLKGNQLKFSYFVSVSNHSGIFISVKEINDFITQIIL